MPDQPSATPADSEPRDAGRDRTEPTKGTTGSQRPPAEDSWRVFEPPPPAPWVMAARPPDPQPMPAAVGWAALATGLIASLLLGEGLGVNLLLVAVPCAVAAWAAAVAVGRRVRPWTLVWGGCGVALLIVPALRDAGWPTFLAVTGAIGLGSLALHGGRTWRGVLLGAVGIFGALLPGAIWGWQGMRERADGSRDRWLPILRTGGTAVALLVVFGALFAGADAAFAELLGGLVPDTSVGDGPWRLLLFLAGMLAALAAARTAAAPWRWDRIAGSPGRPRGRAEWAMPLIVLNGLFAAFIAVQLAVLLGGYDRVLSETGLTYAEYARQGFWQLLTVTVLALVVIAFALRWAPRGSLRDRRLVRVVLGTLCALTLIVVLSALRRMELYVHAYGLTRLRVSVAGVELWLGIVIVLIMAAGLFGGRWLPRVVTAGTGAAVLCFGLLSPDALVAEQNVQRFERTRTIDLRYLKGLSADAVPALDRLPEPQRSCALRSIADELLGTDEPWYATSYGKARARSVLAARPADGPDLPCRGLDREGRLLDDR